MSKSKSKEPQSQSLILAREAFAALSTRSNPFLAGVLRIPLDTRLADSKLGDVRGALVAVKEVLNEIDRKRRELVDPLNGVVRKINAEAKAAAEMPSKVESYGKLLITHELGEREAEARKAAEKDAKKAERRGETQLAEDIRETAADAVSVAGNGVNVRELWEAQVTDIKALLAGLNDLAPIIRDALLGAFIEAADKVLTPLARQARCTESGIPGVTFVARKSVSVAA